MKTVMVGYDGSEQGADALVFSATLADAFAADLVVAVVDELPFALELAPPDARANYVRRVLDRAAKILGDTEYESKTIWGSVPECLELVATDVSADVVVVGSTHHGRVGQVVPGSVGERLLAGASCAIAVAPKGFADQASPQLKRIGVGCDGEEESKAALELANTVAAAVGGSLRLIAVPPVSEKPEPGRISGTAPGYARFVREHLAGVLEGAHETTSPTVEVAEVLLEGDAATVLREQSRELDLLVLGSRGYGPIRRVFLGGVAGKVIDGASCPVLITPRSALGGRQSVQATLASTVI